MKRKILPQKFFTRPALQVARDLLGKFLIREFPSPGGVDAPRGRGGLKQIALMITEVEAYDGPRDKASHASRGETRRNAIMFGAGGYFYVYLCYGMYEMLNIVTGAKDYPAAILLRSAIINFPLIRGVDCRRGRTGCVTDNMVLDGPGKLTRFLKIDHSFNKKPADKSTSLWFEDRGVKIPDKMIRRAPRIGVAYAGPIWSKKKYRFFLTKT
ncbi:MAG: DNA-3-methyladenine glycosylase [Patescibacteria group bacterium]|nr:DNA-3-methyladenine glycosylase [Patescibacteria group bacterium]